MLYKIFLCGLVTLGAFQIAHAESSDVFADQNLAKAHAKLLQEEEQLLKNLAISSGETAESLSDKALNRADDFRAAVSNDSPARNERQQISEKLQDIIEEQIQLKEVEIAQLKARERSQTQTLSAREAALASLRSQHAAMDDRLKKADNREKELIRQLEEAKNRLFIAEIEVERLSNVLNQRNKESLAGFSTSPQQQPAANARASVSRTAQAQNPRVSAVNDMPIATVTVDNANLRTGPGLNNSPLMTVSRNTRLTVETRQGDWYRVISPTGARAWIASAVVSFGPSPSESPTDTVRIRGYDTSIEDKAFEHIARHSR
jgi:uncharacterized protein YraI